MWDVITFKLAGWFACMFNGKNGRWAYYMSQADVEQGGEDLNGWTMRENNNPFAMHVSEFTTHANGGTDGDGGTVANYKWRIKDLLWVLCPFTWPFFKFGIYYRAWLDRFAWDDRYVEHGKLSVEEWAKQVAAHGYAGGANATPAQRGAYARAIVQAYDSNRNWFSKFTSDNAGWIGTAISWILLALCIAFCLWLLWLLLKALGLLKATRRRRRKKKRNGKR